ncbi:epidermal growth factor-like protein 7 isoform X2 [Heterodontus francisci]|uniref:epidermal growth factor-like protein 7 isoform X2 n=1 Tax=Heterodontus francisci TaxID=7792 RepID=UPI00355B7725
MDRLFRNPSPSEGLLPVSFRRSEGADKGIAGKAEEGVDWGRSEGVWRGAITKMWALCLALGLVLSSSLRVSCQHLQGRRRVCSKQIQRVPLVYTESYIQPVYKPYITLCEGRRVCSTYRTIYKVTWREVRRVAYQTEYQCCPGWRKKHSQDTTCEIDVNECRSRVQLCGQRCVNTPGSYRCKCLPGYTLNVDGRSCEKSAMTTSPSFTSPVSLPAGTKETVSTGLGNEVPELHSRLESLEQKMEWTLRTFENLILAASDQMHLDDPMSLENTQNLISHFQQLDRIESLSEQIAFLEERLDSCSCHDQN